MCPQMRAFASFLLPFALGLGLALVFSLNQDDGVFKVHTDGSRAIFSFLESDWDAVFGTISLREMNSTLSSVLLMVKDLQQQINNTKSEYDEYKIQQAVSCSNLIISLTCH